MKKTGMTLSDRNNKKNKEVIEREMTDQKNENGDTI